MRSLFVVVLVVALLDCGCAGRKTVAPLAANPTLLQRGNQKLIVTPETAPVGKVVKVNAAGRFVVLTFPMGWLPALETRLSVYRRGLKVGEVRVAGPDYEDNIVGDIVAGEAAVGDEARSL